MAEGHALIINRYDDLLAKESDPKAQTRLRQQANEEMAQLLKKDAATTLDQVLFVETEQSDEKLLRSVRRIAGVKIRRIAVEKSPRPDRRSGWAQPVRLSENGDVHVMKWKIQRAG